MSTRRELEKNQIRHMDELWNVLCCMWWAGVNSLIVFEVQQRGKPLRVDTMVDRHTMCGV